MPDPHDAITQRLDAGRDSAIQRLREFLAIPSVSTDPAHEADVQQAAEYVAQALREAGLDAEVMETDGHPAVVGTTREDQVDNPAAPRLLFYGHYDVQPPDPVDQWDTRPFEPTVRDGILYARGASDDKGQVACFLEALRAYKEAGQKLPGPVTVLIEGEEEVGSPSLAAFIEQHKDKLAADVVAVSDTTMWDKPGHGPVPAITYALRGLVYFDLKLHGPSRDLHSGVYGGALANPATELVRVLGHLFDDLHRVTIPGFYDDVDPITDEETQRWADLRFDETQFLGDVGSVPFGEADYTTLQRRWARPACDINGLYGGYMGEGAKTVIPTFAGAKVSFRIPASMDPAKVARQFRDWLKQWHDIPGCRWEITEHGMAHPVATPIDSPYMVAASEAIRRAAGAPPVLTRSGATIPVVADFKRLLGADTLLIGFGLNSDGIHSPNECFGLDRFGLGCRTHAALLRAIAGVGG